MVLRYAATVSMRSLAARLFATYLSALLLTTCMIAALFVAVFMWNMDLVTQRYLAHEVEMLERSLRFDSQNRPVAIQFPSEAQWVYKALSTDLRFRVLDASGALLLASDGDSQVFAPSGTTFDPRRTSFDLVAGGVTLHVATVRTERGGHVYYIQAASSERLAALVLRVIWKPVVQVAFWIVIFSVALLGLALHFTQRRMLRPLRDASDAAARIEPRNLSTRLVTLDVPTELAPLLEAFNLALDRLEKGFKVQQEFLASAAHELKTPLALIRGQIEMTGVADRTSLLRDVDFMARQVHQLLHLAEVSEPQNYVFESTQLTKVVKDVVAYAGRLAARRNVYLGLRCVTDEQLLKADRSALFVLLKNLVENAIQHSPNGGLVSVIADSRRILVRDEGRGIPVEHLPKLFLRFWRGPDRQDGGAGLGLAICLEIAQAHDWTLKARNGERGAEFELIFGHK